MLYRSRTRTKVVRGRRLTLLCRSLWLRGHTFPLIFDTLRLRGHIFMLFWMKLWHHNPKKGGSNYLIAASHYLCLVQKQLFAS